MSISNLLILQNKFGSNLDRVIDLLMEADRKVTGNRKRHFEHSLVHLTRHRVYQAFLVISGQEETTEEVSKKLFDIAMASVMGDGVQQQLSVRYLTEWLAVNLITRRPVLMKAFQAHYQQAETERLGCMQSLITIW